MSKVISLGGATDKGAYKRMPFYRLQGAPLRQKEYTDKVCVLAHSEVGDARYEWIIRWAHKILFDRPDWYDGATGDEERGVVYVGPNGDMKMYTADYKAQVHDALQASGYTDTYKRLRASDWLLDKMMRDAHSDGYATGKRQMVELIRFVQVRRVKKYAKNWTGHRDQMDQELDDLLNGYTPNYGKLWKWVIITVVLVGLAMYGAIKIVTG